jgi:hypothetical protein
MERESSKHSPRVDEQMEHEVESLVRGNAAEESRSREDLLQEGSAEGEIRFEPADRTLSQDRGIGIPDGAADGRSELARHIVTAPWPAGRDELVEAARVDRAPQEVIDQLRHLPAEARFGNVQEVWAALGGPVEDTHTHTQPQH